MWMPLPESCCQCCLCMSVCVRPIVHALRKRPWVFVSVCCVCVCSGDHVVRLHAGAKCGCLCRRCSVSDVCVSVCVCVCPYVDACK